jgi:hypothetical protein
MIKLYKVGIMEFTPFNDPEDINFLRTKGIIITDNLEECDIFIACSLKQLNRLRIKFGAKKKYLVWTSEPRKDNNFTNKTKPILWLPGVHIMNVYTDNIYLNNYTLPFAEDFFKNYWKIQPLEFLNENNCPEIKPKVATLIFYRNDRKKWSFKKQGVELDLSYLRTQLALFGHKLNMVDIYGKGWTEGLSIEKSRGGNWQKRKGEILDKYDFNLCFENTNFDYYCTEKIWDSIRYKCLPIYYGKGNKIYENFPKSSFVDYCEFNDPQLLFDCISRMKINEYRERMNLCIEVFNKIIEETRFNNPYEAMLLKTIQNIIDIMES